MAADFPRIVSGQPQIAWRRACQPPRFTKLQSSFRKLVGTTITRGEPEPFQVALETAAPRPPGRATSGRTLEDETALADDGVFLAVLTYTGYIYLGAADHKIGVN